MTDDDFDKVIATNYAASKADVIGMSKSWAKEFTRKDVPARANCVASEYILTEMLKNAPEHLLEDLADQTMLKRLGKPEEIAEIITFPASDKASYITCAVIDVDGGMRLE